MPMAQLGVGPERLDEGTGAWFVGLGSRMDLWCLRVALVLSLDVDIKIENCVACESMSLTLAI
jgi:hypothetical protein